MPDPLDETQNPPIESPTPLPSAAPAPTPAPVATPPTPVVEAAPPATEAAPPVSWYDVRTDPSFSGLAPEKQLVTFDRWYNTARAYAEKQPDWSTQQQAFEAGAVTTQDNLRKAAGGVTPFQARVKIATDKLEGAKGELGVAELAPQAERDLLKQAGPDVAHAYLQHKAGADEQPEGWDFKGILKNVQDSDINLVKSTLATIDQTVLGAAKGAVRYITPDLMPEEEWKKQGQLGYGAAKAIHDNLTHFGDFLQTWKEEVPAGVGADKGTVADQGGQFIGGLVPYFAALPIAVVAHVGGAYGDTYDETKSKGKAAGAAALAGLTDILFMQLAHFTSGVGKNIPNAAARWATSTAAGTAGNIGFGQLNKAAQSALTAPPEERYAKFKESLSEISPFDAGVQTAFALLATKHAEQFRAQSKARAEVAADVDNLKKAGAPEMAKAVEETAAQEALDAADAITAPPAEAAPPVAPDPVPVTTEPPVVAAPPVAAEAPITTPEITPEETQRTLDAAEAADRAAKSKIELRIDGPVLVDEAGKIIARGKVGETHEDLMKAGLANDNPDPILEAFADESRHKFGDNLDPNAAHAREAAHVIAADAGQVPQGAPGDKLHSQMLTAEAPAPEAQPPEVATPAVQPPEVAISEALPPETMLDNTDAQSKQIASELGLDFKGVQEGYKGSPGHLMFTDPQAKGTGVAAVQGNTIADFKAHLEETRSNFNKPAGDPHAELATRGYEVDDAGVVSKITPDEPKPLTKNQLAKLPADVQALVEQAKGAGPAAPPETISSPEVKTHDTLFPNEATDPATVASTTSSVDPSAASAVSAISDLVRERNSTQPETGAEPGAVGDGVRAAEPDGAKPLQVEGLLAWAKAQSRLLTYQNLNALVSAKLERGSEHIPWMSKDGKNVIKITDAGEFGHAQTPVGYLRNLALSNRVFGTGRRLLGIIEDGKAVTGETGIHIVTQEPFISGTIPRPSEVEAFMKSEGFGRRTSGEWFRDADGVSVSDTAVENFVKLESGQLVPIDVQVEQHAASAEKTAPPVAAPVVEPVAPAKPDVAEPAASAIPDATFTDPAKVAELLAGRGEEKLYLPDELVDEDKVNPAIEFTYDKEAGKYYVTSVKAEPAPAAEAPAATPDELVASSVQNGLPPENFQAVQKVAGGNKESAALNARIKVELANAYPAEVLPPEALPSTTISPADGEPMSFVSENTGRQDSNGNPIRTTRPVFTNDPVDIARKIDAGRNDIFVPEGTNVNPRITVEVDKATGRQRVVSVDLPRFGIIDEAGKFEAAYKANPDVAKRRDAQTKGKERQLTSETQTRQDEVAALPPAGGSIEAEAAQIEAQMVKVKSRIDADVGNYDKARLTAAVQEQVRFLLRQGKTNLSPWRLFVFGRNNLIKFNIDRIETSLDAPMGEGSTNTRHDLAKDEGQSRLNENRAESQADFDYQGEPDALETYLEDNHFDPNVQEDAPDIAPEGAIAIGADNASLVRKSSPENRDLMARNMQVLERLGIFTVAAPLREGSNLPKPVGKRLVADPVGVALNSLASDPGAPGWLRLVSRLLVNSSFDTSNITLKLTNSPNASWAGLQQHANGGTDVTRSTVTLNTGVHSINSLAHTLVHEVVHHVTVAKLGATYERTPTEEVAYKTLYKLYEHAVSGVFESIHGRSPTSDEWIAFVNAQGAGKVPDTHILGANGVGIVLEKNRDFYGLSNIHEFVTEVLTNPKFMSILDKMPAVEKAGPLSGKFNGLLNVVRAAIKSLFAGKTVTPRSALDQALDAAMTIATSGTSSQVQAEAHYLRGFKTEPNYDASNKQEQAAQITFLNNFARENGYDNVNDLAKRAPELFYKAAVQFRASVLPPIEASASAEATVSREEKAAVDALLKDQFGKAVAPATVSEQATMERRQTTAMANQLEAHTPFVREQLRKTEYLSSTNEIDKATVGDYLKKSTEAGVSLEQMVHEIDSATTFDLNLDKAQRALARAGVATAAEKTALKLADSISKNEPIYNAQGEALNIPALEKQRLVRHYLDMSVEQNRKVQVDVLSEAGSILSRVGALLARTFSPHATRQEYSGPIEGAQAAGLKGDAGTQAVKAAIDAGKRAGATAAITRADKVLKNIVGLDQTTFDFFDNVWSKWVADATQNNTGFPVTIDAANKAAKNIVEQFLVSQHPGDGPVQRGLVDTLRAKLESRVSSQITERLSAKPERPETTPEEQIKKNIKSLVEDTDVAGLMERAFNSATADLIESGELSPEQATKLSEGFDFGKLDSAQRLVRDFSDMRDRVRRHLLDRDASKATLVSAVLEQSPQLRTEQAEIVAKALNSAFDLAAKAETQKQLNELTKDKRDINRVKPEQVSDLLRLANLGAYEDAALYNQIAENNPKLKLPVLDAAFVDHLQVETDRIQRLPADSDMRRTALLKLQSEISWKHAKDMLTGRNKVGYYVGKVGPAIWQAGVLSGPPTQEVNFLSTLTNVHLQGFFSALGHSIDAVKRGVPASEVGSFFTDSMVGWWDAAGIAKLVPLLTGGRIEAGRMGPAASAVEFGRALKTGTTKFRSEKGEGASVLEQYKLSNFDPRGFHKFVLRLSSALDGFNSVTANEMQQRLAMRHSLLLKGERGAELRAKMQDAFNPAIEVHQKIADQVAAEADAGAFATGKEGVRERKIRTLELLENRRDDIVPGVKLEGRDAAEDWTFNKQPVGVVGAIFDGAFGSINRAVPAGKFFFSFMRTTANLINTSLDFSPIGIARAKNVSISSTMSPKNPYYSRIEPNSPEYYNKMSQGVLGTVAIAAVGSALWAGIQAIQRGEEPYFMVYGAGPSTSLEREQLKQGDQWLPNSVKIGKFRFTYTDWPVMNLALGALGTVADGVVYNRYKEKGYAETAALMGLGIVTSVFEKRLLQGLNTIMDMVRNPDQRGLNAIKTAASGIVSGFTNPQALKWLRDTVGVDPTTGKVPTLDQGTTEGWLMSMVPMSIGYNAPRINVLGEEIQHHPWEPTLRRFGNFDPFTPDPILTPLVRAGLTLPLPSKNTIIKLPNGNITSMGANPELYNAYVRYKGQALKQMLTPEIVQMIVTSDPDTAANMLKGDFNRASKGIAIGKLYDDMAAGRIKITHEKAPGK